MLQQLNVVGDACESTFVLKRKADILSVSYDISIHQWHSNIQYVKYLIIINYQSMNYGVK